MQKKIISVVLAILMVVAIVPVSAFAEDDILDYLEYEIVDGEVTITDCDESISGEVIIPDTIEGYPVTAIGDYAFSACKNLKNIVIPEGVTTLGEAVFESCINLSNVSLPDSIVDIGYGAFVFCENITEIKIPDGVKTIKSGTFIYCENLEKIEIPDSVSTIEFYAFKGCTSLKEIVLPKHLISIDEMAFIFCSSLESVTIPAEVQNIGPEAFFGCMSLQTIVFESNVENIYSNAFTWCPNITTVYAKDVNMNFSQAKIGFTDFIVKIPIDTFIEYTRDYYIYTWLKTDDGGGYPGEAPVPVDDACEFLDEPVKIEDFTIHGYAGSTAEAYANEYGFSFEEIVDEKDILDYLEYEIVDGEVTITGCDTSISGEVVIPDTIEGYPVTVIGNDAFYDCASITDIIIPDSVTTIGVCAFANCEKIQSITIPCSVKIIDSSAFYGISNIIVDKDNQYYSSDEFGVLFNKDKTELIQYPTNNTREEYVIPDIVEKIGVGAFAENIFIKKIIIPECVNSIDYYSFGSCFELDSIVLPDGIIEIPERAFECCMKLKSITISKNVTSIGSEAFNACYALENIIIYNPICSIFDSPDTIYIDTVIYGYTGSSAQEYAEKYDREFVALDTECAHDNTEIINCLEPDCNNDGYTGDVYCNDCGEIIEYGEVITATDHTDADNNSICDVCETVLETVQPAPEEPVEPEVPADPEDTEESQSFFDKLVEFFKKIIEFIKNLFV